jgi:Fe-S-cluster containining protein
MLIPLNHHEAAERWTSLGLGTIPRWIEYSSQALYTCRHWDTETRLCTQYENRPALCRNYPYRGSCNHEGCTYRMGIPYLIREAANDWAELEPKEGLTADA